MGSSPSERWWCLQKPTVAEDRRAADLPGLSTCRDKVVGELEALSAGGGEQSFTVAEVYGVMVTGGTSWPRATVAKTMLRMTRPAHRPPYLRLVRIGTGWYYVHRHALPT